MHRSKIPSPARSEGGKITPRRHRFRSSRSVSSPARSDVSVKLSSIVQMHAMQSPALSPMKTRRSVLSDNTDIEAPQRQSWWKRLEENSRDVMEVFESKTTEQPENIEEYVEVDFKSQENDYTVDLPDSSDGESINSIVLPQRKFFCQKQTQSNKLFNKIIENRENMTHRKSKANTDNTIFVGKKSFFNKDTEARRSRPAFPPGLLNMTDKTIMNKTQDITKHEQVRNLLGNRAGTKRKNMFADFIMSESEEEIPDIEPNVFGFTKTKQPQHKLSQGTRNTSPRSNETDLEFDDWQHLPSSTMVDNDLENIESSPVKRPRLSKPDSVIEEVRGNVRNKLDKTKLTLIMSNGDELEESGKKHPKNTHEKTLTEIPEADDPRPFIAEIIQVDSDDDNNFTLRYDNDDKNIQGDEIDVTVKEIDKDNTNNINTTVTNAEKVLKSPSSLEAIQANIRRSFTSEEMDAIDGTKKLNQEDKNLSWKVLKTHKEQHATINVREDLAEKETIKNISVLTTNKKHEKDNCEMKGNNSINKENTIIESAQMLITTPEEAAIVKRKQKDDIMREEQSKVINRSSNNNEQIEKSLENVNMEVDGEVNNVTKTLNEITEEGNHNKKENTKQLKEKTNTHISVEASIVKNRVEDTKLNESQKEVVQETSIPTLEERNTTNCEENREFVEECQKEHNVNPDMAIDEMSNKSSKESQQIAVATMDENMDQTDSDNRNNANENEVVENEQNIETTNKSLESQKEASLNENILTDDEDSNRDEENITEDNETTNRSQEESNKMTSVENNVTDEDNEGESPDGEESKEESAIQNESDKQSRVSSIDANIETDGEENNKESDEEGNDENDVDENEITEENDNKLEASSINKSNESDNKGNNTNNEDNEEGNESDEGISDRIGMPSMDIESDEDDDNNEEINEEQDRGDCNAKNDTKVTLSKGRIYLTNVTGESTHSYVEEAPSEPEEARSEPEEARSEPEEAQSEPEEAPSRHALEEYLMKIKQDNIEKRRKMEEEVRNSLKITREPFNNFKAPARPRPRKTQPRTEAPQTKTREKKITSLLNIENLPPELLDDMKYKPPRRYQPKSAAWITKRLYKYLETKLEPKYDYKARVKAEKVVESLYEFSKEVRRQRVAAPHLVHALKLQLARAGLVTTHYDFYNFLHDFMPREIRVKVVPDVVNEIPLPKHGVFSDIV